VYHILKSEAEPTGKFLKKLSNIH